MTNFNERIERLAELGNCARKGSLVYDTIKQNAVPLLREMAQALSEAQEENERLKAEEERTDKAFSKTLKDLTLSKRESKKFCDLMMKNVNKCCEFQNEIERLREGIARALEQGRNAELIECVAELEALNDA